MKQIKPDLEKTKEAAKTFLECLGIDLADANFKDTPLRMARTYAELCKYLYKETRKELTEELSRQFSTKYRGMIIQEPIRAYSLCSHHLLPVTYDILFGYIPTNLTLGFSKSVKVINLLAARPISQEDLTQEIIDKFDKSLKPKGIMVVVRGVHMCMLIRGAKTGAVNITSALKGEFKDKEKTRNEFLTLAKFNNGD